MKNVLFLNSPCQPKKTYHCGNAISQIVSEICVNYFAEFKKDFNIYYVKNSWNLHGIPFEKSYFDEFGKDGDYEEIKIFSERYINNALKEKSLFCYLNQKINIIDYKDTEHSFNEYTQKKFIDLYENGFLKKENGELFLDLSKILRDDYQYNNVDEINIFPKYHSNTITNNSRMIGNKYQLTKQRIFTTRVNIDGHTYSINPIFQSFIFPLYISDKYKTDYPAFLQVSSSWQLKWHYLRNIISRLLSKKSPYSNLFLHGIIMGEDGNRMSKNSNNAISPSDLYNIIPDSRFIRHTLINSISDKEICIQVKPSISQFNNILDKLNIIKSNKFKINNLYFDGKKINNIIEDLDKNKIKKAFSDFYYLIKKNDFIITDNETSEVTENIFKIYRIFYGE